MGTLLHTFRFHTCRLLIVKNELNTSIDGSAHGQPRMQGTSSNNGVAFVDALQLMF